MPRPRRHLIALSLLLGLSITVIWVLLSSRETASPTGPEPPGEVTVSDRGPAATVAESEDENRKLPVGVPAGEGSPVIAAGQVLMPTGAPAGAGLSVIAWSGSLGALAESETDETGGFLLRVEDRQARERIRGSDPVPVVLRTGSADGRLVATSRAIPPEDLGPSAHALLVMQAGGMVRGRAVGPSGSPVSAAEVLVLSVATASTWVPGSGFSAHYRVTAGPDGRFELPLRTGEVWVWCSDGGQVFGPRATGRLAAGEVCDLGDVSVGEAAVETTLLVVDGGGRPLPGAGITMQPALQWLAWADSGTRDCLVHRFADEAGRISLRLPVGPGAVQLAVGAPLHCSVRITLGTGSPDPRTFQVVLPRRPIIDILLRAGNSPVTLDALAPAWTAIPSGGAPAPLHLSLGTDESLIEPAEGDEHAEFTLDMGIDHPVREVEPGRYRITVPGPGTYLVEGRIAGQAPLGTRVAVPEHAPFPVLTMDLPKGREVAVVARPPSTPVAGRRPARGTEIESGFSVAPDGANWREAAVALTAGGSLSSPVLRSTIWVSAETSHILAGPYLDTPSSRIRRFALPAEEGAEAVIDYPLYPLQEDWPELRLQVTLGGKPLSIPDLEFLVSRDDRRSGGPAVPGTEASLIASDRRGAARLRLPPDHYKVSLLDQLGECEAIPIDLGAGADGRTLEVDLFSPGLRESPRKD